MLLTAALRAGASASFLGMRGRVAITRRPSDVVNDASKYGNNENARFSRSRGHRCDSVKDDTHKIATFEYIVHDSSRLFHVPCKKLLHLGEQNQFFFTQPQLIKAAMID
jgi:hypothetical protein